MKHRKLAYRLALICIMALPPSAGMFAVGSMQRMMTDYRGVAHKGNLVLVYGSNGVITWTNDKFEHASRLNIGADNDILLIESVPSGFVGCTRNKLVYSGDGMRWSFVSRDTVMDAVVFRDTLYVLSTYTVDMYSTAGVPRFLASISLDSNNVRSHIAVDEGHVYVSSDMPEVTTISKDGRSTSVSTVDLSFIDLARTTITDIMYHAGAMYVLTATRYAPSFYGTVFHKSTDGGKNWRAMRTMIANGRCSIMERDSVYALRTVTYLQPSQNGNISELLRLSYVKLDSSHIVKDSLDYIEINRTDSTPDRIVYRNSYYANRGFQGLRRLQRIDGSTLVAAGDANMIAISVDNGSSWRFASVFKVQDQGREQVQVLDSNRVAVFDGPIVYVTTNGGVTWLPPKYKHCPELDVTRLDAFTIRPDGRCILKFSSRDTLAANILVMNDRWDSFVAVARDSTYALFDTSHKETVYVTDSRTAMPFKDGFIQASSRTVYDKGGRSITKSSIVFLDSQLVLLAVRPFADTSRLIGMVRPDNKDIYAIGLKEQGVNLYDSLGQTTDYRYRYFLARLDEQSEQWVTVIDSLPFRQDLIQLNGKYRYVNVIDKHCVSRNDIIYCRNRERTVYTVDVATRKMDSVLVPVRFTSMFTNGIEMDGDSFRYVGANQVIYTSRADSFSTWDSTNLRQTIENWNPYDYIDNPWGFDNVGVVYKRGDVRSYIQTISTGDIGFRWVEVIRVDESGDISPAEERDNPDPYLSCSPWFPHPAYGLTSSNVTWDNPSAAGTPDVDLMDMFGRAVAPGRLSSVATSDHSLRVTCNTSGLARGVYVARISHGRSVVYRTLIVD